MRLQIHWGNRVFTLKTESLTWRLNIQREQLGLLLEMETATLGSLAQITIWLIGIYLNWF